MLGTRVMTLIKPPMWQLHYSSESVLSYNKLLQTFPMSQDSCLDLVWLLHPAFLGYGNVYVMGILGILKC